MNDETDYIKLDVGKGYFYDLIRQISRNTDADGKVLLSRQEYQALFWILLENTDTDTEEDDEEDDEDDE